MGYTLYWSAKKLTRTDIKRCVNAIKRIIAEYEGTVKVQYPKVVDEYNINFNGIGEGALETFYLYTKKWLKTSNPDDFENGHYVADDGSLGYVYCKTEQRPYDRAVKECLIEMQKITGNKFEIHCDDGVEYDKDGCLLTGKGLYDWAKPVKPVRFQLKDLPLKYMRRGGEQTWGGKTEMIEPKECVLGSDYEWVGGQK